MKLAANSPLRVTLRWSPGDEAPVGRLAYRDRRAYLEFDSAFLKQDRQISPIHHPLATGVQQSPEPALFEGLHGVFNDSLPDGWGRLLIDRRCRELGIAPASLTPLDRLACVGDQGIGALCYAPAIDAWASGGDEIDLDRLAASARLVLAGDVNDVISELGRAGGSPGGARPKALLAIASSGHAVHGTDSVPADHVHHLVKFPGADDPADIARIELAYSAMAAAAGIEMPAAVLLPSGGGAGYFGVRRFDRDGDQRVHVHSASGLLYADAKLPSLDYDDLLRLTRKMTRDQRACEEMYRRAVFNVLAHNRDDHARQFSFIMTSDGCWRLSPAYDLTYSDGPGGEHSTSVRGKGKDISRADLRALGRVAELKSEDADAVIDQVAEAISDWPKRAGDFDVSRSSRNRIAAALEAISIPG